MKDTKDKAIIDWLKQESGTEKALKTVGRRKVYASNAEKQKAYRDRQKQKGLKTVSKWVVAEP